MNAYTIKLLDKVTNVAEFVERFECENVPELELRLFQLQKGYCEDESPQVSIFEHKGNVYLIAECDSDFSYIAKFTTTLETVR